MEHTLHTPNMQAARILRQYREMSWHNQRQWLFVVLAAIVVAALVAGLYLNVTARAAITGRQIQTLEQEIILNQRINADLQADIALQLSIGNLERRAEKMGFQPVAKDEIQYIVVPGYFPNNTVSLTSTAPQQNILLADPAFKQSLFEWLHREISAAATPLPVFQP